MSAPRVLIVNADDMGLSPAVDRGILAAHRDGIVTSVSLLVTLPEFRASVERLRSCRQLGVGVHLSLTCGQRVSRHRPGSRLTARDGRLPSLRRMLALLAARRLEEAEVDEEVAAQIDRARDAGVEPTHVDTHHNVHLHPFLRRAIDRAAADRGIHWVRFRGQRPLAWPALARAGAPRLALRARYWIGQALASRAGRDVRHAGTPRWIAGAPAPPGGLASGLAEFLCALPIGLTELVCHPGEIDSELLRWDPGTAGRRAELEALRRPELREQLAARGVRCTHYGALEPAAELEP